MTTRTKDLKTHAAVWMTVLLILFLLLTVKAMFGQTNMGPVKTPQINSNLYVGQTGFATIQSTVSFACSTGNKSYAVVILPGVITTDSPTVVTGGCSGTYISDMHTLPIANYQWNGSAYVLVSSGGGGGTPPGGPTNAVQINAGGTFTGYAGFNYDPATGILTVPQLQTTGPTHGFTVSSGPAPPGAAGSVVYASDNSGIGYAMVNEGATGLHRICTSSNSSSVPGCGGTGGGVTSNAFGLWSAMANNTGGMAGGANGVANILANPTFQAQAARSILMDPNYTEYDSTAMSPPVGISTAAVRQTYLDMRQGTFRFLSRDPGPRNQSNFGVIFECQSYHAVGSAYGADPPGGGAGCLNLNYTSLIPGYSYGAIAPAQPSGWFGTSAIALSMDNHSASISKSLLSAIVNNSGKGDQQIFDYNFTNYYGGGDESAGEGNHLERWSVSTGGDFTGDIYADAIDQPTQGNVLLKMVPHGNLGVRRILLNTARNVITDTITGTSVNADRTQLLTMSGSVTYPISKTVQLAGDISPPASSEQAKTLTTFTISTATPLDASYVGKPFQIVNTDGSLFTNTECAVINTVGSFSGGTQTLKAYLGEYHQNGSNMNIGGMACHYLTMDNTHAASNVTVTYYIVGSPAGNQLQLLRIMGGKADPSMWWTGTAAAHIYTGAQVLDVRCAISTCLQAGETPLVEETGATWLYSDTVKSGMMASAMNDTFHFFLYEGNPMSVGSTYVYALVGAQMGASSPRNFWNISNQPAESDYVTGGGPWSEGDIFHWSGPVNNVFRFDNLIHGYVVTDFQCGWGLAQALGSLITHPCPRTTGDGYSWNLAGGWTLQGDVTIQGGSGGDTHNIAVFSGDTGMNAIHFMVPTTLDPTGYATGLTINQQNGSGSTNPALAINGATAAGDGVALVRVQNASGRFIQLAPPHTFPTVEPGISNYGLTLTFDLLNAGTGLNAESDLINSHWDGSSGGFAWYDIKLSATGYANTPIMRLTGTGDLSLHSLTCTGTPCGSGGGGGPVYTGTNFLVGPTTSTYHLDIQSNDNSQAQILTTDESQYAVMWFGSAGHRWQMASGGTSTGPLASHWYLYDASSTPITVMDVAPGGNVKFAGNIVMLTHDTPGSGSSCGTHPANAIWADDGFVYHCNNAGTAIGRAALSSF